MPGFPISSAIGPGKRSCVFFVEEVAGKKNIAYFKANARNPVELSKENPPPGQRRLEYTQQDYVKAKNETDFVHTTSEDLDVISFINNAGAVATRIYYVGKESGSNETILKELCLDQTGKENPEDEFLWSRGALNDLKLKVAPDNYVTVHINDAVQPKQLKVYSFGKDKKKPSVAWINFEPGAKWQKIDGEI